jgi:hypothetical protein
VMWTGLVWLGVGTSGELWWIRYWTFRFDKMLRNYRVSKQLGISRVVHSSMELVMVRTICHLRLQQSLVTLSLIDSNSNMTDEWDAS